MNGGLLFFFFIQLLFSFSGKLLPTLAGTRAEDTFLEHFLSQALYFSRVYRSCVGDTV